MKVEANSQMAQLMHCPRWHSLNTSAIHRPWSTQDGARDASIYQSLFAPALPALGDVDVDAQGWAMTLSTGGARLEFYGYWRSTAVFGYLIFKNLRCSVIQGANSKFQIELGAEAGLAYEAGVGLNRSTAEFSDPSRILEYLIIYQRPLRCRGESGFEDKPVVQRVNADEGRVLSTLARGWIYSATFS